MDTPKIRQVGVVGAGVIGSGVAQLFAQTGHEVVLVDVSDTQLAAARDGIAKNVRLYNLLRKDRGDAPDVLSRLRYSGETGALESVDFVIENITEDWDSKRRLHREIDRIIAPVTPVAANTSAIRSPASLRPDAIPRGSSGCTS